MKNLLDCSGPARPPSSPFLLFSVLAVFLLGLPLTLRGEEVDDLLRDLAAAQRAVRVAAEEKLIQLGPRILSKLPRQEEIADPAVREALLRIREIISERKVREALQASPVSLEGNPTLDQALQEIERQTGNHVDVTASAREKPALSHPLRIKNTPFWDALQNLASAFSLRLTFPPGRTHPLLTRKAENSPPLAFVSQGPFLWIWERTEIRSSPFPGKDLVRAHLIFAMEPRLRGLFVTYSPAQMPLSSTDGQSLSPFNPEASIELPFNEGSHSVKCEVEYLLPRDSKLQTLNWQGHFSLLIAAGEERFEFQPQQQTTGKSQRQGEVSVTFFPVQFEAANQGAEIVGIPLALSYDRTGPAFESHRLWIFRNRAELVMPDGKKLSPRDCETRLQQQNVVLMDYKFKASRAEGAKATFVYFAPTHIVTEKVPLEFRGVSSGLK